MSSRKDNGYSPQKEVVRRSGRERQAVYKSLDENVLSMQQDSALFRALINQAEHIRSMEARNSRHHERMHEAARHNSAHGYPTRSTRSKVHLDDEFGTTEDEEDHKEIRQNGRRRSRVVHEEGEDIDDTIVTKNDPKRRRVVIEDDDEDRENQDNKDDVDDFGVSMYERVKTRHQTSATPESNRIRSASQPPMESARSVRLRERGKRTEGEEDEEKDAEETEEDEEQGPRQYELRRNRAPVSRYAEEQVKADRKPARLSRVEEMMMRRAREHKRRRGKERTRRRPGAGSDSTDTSDDGGGGSRHKDRDDDKFERRKARSMQAARNRFMPINLTGKDLSASQSVIHERIRQTGASCSDIDPMSIDSSVGFDQVGGLGHHIQSLKEVVLFPMLYPEIFGRFNINPPKGVVFYGPPGTGKTLVARALANECSKGAKKVAFFMRKGADCLSKWVGESERQLRLLFDQAYAMRPSIIFFDEIDGLAPVRSSRQDQIHSSIVSTLLALMDGLDSRGEVVVIGATNRLDTLDPALRRPGRFDRELKFNLPDCAARRQIVEIHTEKWGESKPDDETIEWLSESSSGYCGADLKYLCTEAVLISLRSNYPHIYLSKEKLAIDSSKLKIDRSHFKTAMHRITPASRRDLSIPSRPLDSRTSILLKSTVEMILQIRIPSGYRCSQSVHNLRGEQHDLEKVVRDLETPPIVPAVRLLLCGSDESLDAGQTAYVLPAVLGRLDHLPVFSLAVSRLFADGRPEESLAQTVQSALRAASSSPVILLLPSIDQWFSVVPPSVSHMLFTALDSLTGFTSIMFLATSETSFNGCSQEVKDLFRAANSVQIRPPSRGQRFEYFNYLLFKPSIQPPKRFIASDYECPPIASSSEETKRKLSEKEAKELNKMYDGLLRQFRIFLRDMLARLMRDRRFHIFNSPVEEEDAEDYYQIIEQPMSMTDMMAKIDRKEYRHPNEFLDDINLIMRNALEYNPDKNLEGKTIRHQAIALRDMAEALLDMELDEDFVERLEETRRLLEEAGVDTTRVEEVPFGQTTSQYARRTRLAVKNGYTEGEKEEEGEMMENGEEEERKEKEVETEMASNSAISTPCSHKKGRRRFGTYSFGSGRKGRRSGQRVGFSSESDCKTNGMENGICEEEKRECGKEETLDEEDEDMMEEGESSSSIPIPNGILKSPASSHSNGELNGIVPLKPIDNEEVVQEVMIDKDSLENIINQISDHTDNWAVPELERMAAVIAHTVDSYRNKYDRMSLPSEVNKIVTEWKLE